LLARRRIFASRKATVKMPSDKNPLPFWTDVGQAAQMMEYVLSSDVLSGKSAEMSLGAAATSGRATA
jgi:hypothetical protein